MQLQLNVTHTFTLLLVEWCWSNHKPSLSTHLEVYNCQFVISWSRLPLIYSSIYVIWKNIFLLSLLVVVLRKRMPITTRIKSKEILFELNALRHEKIKEALFTHWINLYFLFHISQPAIHFNLLEENRSRGIWIGRYCLKRDRPEREKETGD